MNLCLICFSLKTGITSRVFREKCCSPLNATGSKITPDYPGWDFCLGLSFQSLMEANQGIIVLANLGLIIRWCTWIIPWLSWWNSFQCWIIQLWTLGSKPGISSSELQRGTNVFTQALWKQRCFNLCVLCLKNCRADFQACSFSSSFVVPCPSSLTNNNNGFMPVPVPPALSLPVSGPQDLSLSLQMVNTSSCSHWRVVSEDIRLLRLGIQTVYSLVSPGLSHYFWLGGLSLPSPWDHFKVDCIPRQSSSKISVKVSSKGVCWVMQHNFTLLRPSLGLFPLPDTQSMCGLDVTVYWWKQQKLFSAPLFFDESI